MPMKNKMEIMPRKEVFGDSPRVARVDTGMKVKKTGPGVLTIKISNPPPSRPQNKERMSVGGSKATQRPKGRVDPKAANPMDPGATPMPNTKVNWPTADKNAQKGYVVGKAWPTKTTHGPNPYSERSVSGGPIGGHSADGANTQDMQGSYSESGQDT